MPRNRVVVPDTTRLTLSDGDFVDVVRELNAGEYNDLLRAMVDRKPFSKILAYVIGWSFVGPDDKPLEYSIHLDEETRRATIRSLDKATFRELMAAIDKHELAEEAALEEKKRMTGAKPASTPISASAG